MVNFGLNTASFLGIILAIAGAGLYFLRSFRPELSRDQDIAFTAIGIICGFILIFQGWRLDPILQFGQLLLSGSTIFFAYENIKLRGITTEQAKGKSQIVDDDRPVSRRYKAEIEDRDYLERPRNGRRIRGEDGRRSSDREEREDVDVPQRRSTRQLTDDRYAEPTPRRRRSASDDSSLARRPSGSRTAAYDERWDGNDDEDWNDSAPRKSRPALPEADLDRDRDVERPARRSARRDTPPERERSSRRDDNPDEGEGTAPRRRRPRPDDHPPGSMMASREEIGPNEGTTANYVDYEPVNPEAGLPASGTEEPIVFPDRY
jgi:Ycf66 protein N-terminus